MILVGQYDSPFVRRVAVTLNHYRMDFERCVLCVFTDFYAVLALNPLGKVRILELDDGERLVDSRAILDHLDEQARPEARLVPIALTARRAVFGVDAIALGLAEKLYERGIETRADVTSAIAVTYLREKSCELLDPDRWPLLTAHCQRCEARPEFARAPYSAAEASRSGWRPGRGQEPS